MKESTETNVRHCTCGVAREERTLESRGRRRRSGNKNSWQRSNLFDQRLINSNWLKTMIFFAFPVSLVAVLPFLKINFFESTFGLEKFYSLSKQSFKQKTTGGAKLDFSAPKGRIDSHFTKFCILPKNSYFIQIFVLDGKFRTPDVQVLILAKLVYPLK